MHHHSPYMHHYSPQIYAHASSQSIHASLQSTDIRTCIITVHTCITTVHRYTYMQHTVHTCTYTVTHAHNSHNKSTLSITYTIQTCHLIRDPSLRMTATKQAPTAITHLLIKVLIKVHLKGDQHTTQCLNY